MSPKKKMFARIASNEICIDRVVANDASADFCSLTNLMKNKFTCKAYSMKTAYLLKLALIKILKSLI